jgi:hypothetical protein
MRWTALHTSVVKFLQDNMQCPVQFFSFILLTLVFLHDNCLIFRCLMVGTYGCTTRSVGDLLPLLTWVRCLFDSVSCVQNLWC